MRLVMAGIDHTTASMAVREAFALTGPDLGLALRTIAGEGGGCVILATCNRTEVYISHRSDVPPDGARRLCRARGLDPERYQDFFRERSERQAVRHLLRVASGLESGVPGDDQIGNQVRAAVEAARAAGTGDALLEALFRTAITTGKRVRSRVRPNRAATSVADRAVQRVRERFDAPGGARALVLGCGVVGRAVAGGLAAHGFATTIALRDPVRRQADAPAGCSLLSFEDRLPALEECDVVVSATARPGFTLTQADIAARARRPNLFVDLALPRDIDPAIADLDGVTLWNIDDLSPPATAPSPADDDGLARAIIQEEAARFDLWRRNRRRHCRTGAGVPDFPLFVSLDGSLILVAGGGRVAARRVEKLLVFGARVRLVSPALGPEMEKLLPDQRVEWLPEPYDTGHLKGATLVIAATDRREVNRRIGHEAKEAGLLVSVADARRECTFFFPAIVKSDCLTAGLVSNHGDHGLVRRAAARMREEMEAVERDDQGREPGERPGGSPGEADTAPHREALRSQDGTGDHADDRRPDPRPSAGGGRRQRPVHQGTRPGPAGRAGGHLRSLP